MYEKQGMYFADWRDKKGVRHRKSFAKAEAALLYEAAEKANPFMAVSAANRKQATFSR